MIKGILALIVIALTVVIALYMRSEAQLRRRLLDAAMNSQNLCAGCFKPLGVYVERCACGEIICTECQECAVCADPIFKEATP
jgi:hypothetical protein